MTSKLPCLGLHLGTNELLACDGGLRGFCCGVVHAKLAAAACWIIWSSGAGALENALAGWTCKNFCMPVFVAAEDDCDKAIRDLMEITVELLHAAFGQGPAAAAGVWDELARQSHGFLKTLVAVMLTTAATVDAQVSLPSTQQLARATYFACRWCMLPLKRQGYPRSGGL